MAENGYWGTKTYHSGRVGEKVKFFVPFTRGRKMGRSSPEKITANANNATRTVARYINDNFCSEDGWLTLTYDPQRYERVETRSQELRKKNAELSEEDARWLAAQHEGELLMDRVRREAKKRGVELRYLFTTSDMSSKTGELVRVHHHLVVCKECVELVKKKWGAAEYAGQDRPEYKERLWDVVDYTPLAEYMMKQVRYIPNAKKYTPSRNLIKRIPKTRRVNSGARIRPPKGCELLYADPYTGKHDCQYIRYILPPEQWTGVWKGKGDISPVGEMEAVRTERVGCVERNGRNFAKILLKAYRRIDEEVQQKMVFALEIGEETYQQEAEGLREIKKKILSALNQLPQVERELIWRHYILREMWVRLAREFAYSEKQVRNIANKGLDQLAEFFSGERELVEYGREQMKGIAH